MNRKQFILLIVLVAVVGGLALITNKNKKGAWESGEKSLTGTYLKDFPLNDVAEIAIKDKEAALTLLKKGDSWTVKERDGYPANFQDIGAFLQKVWDLKPVQQPKVGESQLGRLELEQPGKGEKAGTLVEFKSKEGKALGALLLGKKHLRDGNPAMGGGSFPDGRYVMVPGKLDSIALVAESFNEITPKAADWVSKDFFKVEKAKSVAVTSTNATNAWSLSRETETGEWKLAGLKEGEKPDTAAMGSFNFLLSSPSFNDIAEVKELKDATKATVETFDGFKYDLSMALKAGEEYFLQIAVSANLPKERTPGKDEKPEDKTKLDKEFKERNDKLAEKLKAEKQFEGHTYVVTKWTIDALLKERKDFLAKKEAEGAGKPPAGLPPQFQGLPIQGN
jgi:hypothetical protein